MLTSSSWARCPRLTRLGRYSAACKPLYVMFTGFWLLTDVLYPHIAGVKESSRARRTLFVWLTLLAVASAVVAGVLGFLAPQILTVIYGSPMGAAGLFRVLLIAMPLDFCFSLLWTVLVSRGYDKVVLAALATAAGHERFAEFAIHSPISGSRRSVGHGRVLRTSVRNDAGIRAQKRCVVAQRGGRTIASPSEYAL